MEGSHWEASTAHAQNTLPVHPGKHLPSGSSTVHRPLLQQDDPLSTIRKMLAERDVRVVSYADWQKIDAAEVAAATPPAPRRKLGTLANMLAVLDG